jgi:hypothetical protein
MSIDMATTPVKRPTAKSTREAAAKIHPRRPKQRAAQTVASRLPATGRPQIDVARQKFEKGVVARGEVVEAGQPLPAGATHEIVGRRRDGTALLKRKRFSAR